LGIGQSSVLFNQFFNRGRPAVSSLQRWYDPHNLQFPNTLLKVLSFFPDHHIKGQMT
jgi:hypothetical protein